MVLNKFVGGHCSFGLLRFTDGIPYTKGPYMATV